MARDYADLIEGTLVSQLATATTTGVQMQLKKVNGAYPTFPTGQTEIRLKRVTEDGTYFERAIVAAGSSTNSTTGVATLGTLTRNCSLTDGTDTTGTAATIIWPASTQVYIPWGVGDAELTPKLNEVNTFTAGSALRSTSTTSALVRANSVTTAQRTGMSAANGDIVYDTDLGQFYKYEGGAWAAVATGTFANAANGTKGGVDLATAAEVAAGTATDASSSAPNVIPVSIVKPSSTGAVEGTVPSLNSSVALDRTIGGLGTTSGTAYTLIANGTSSTSATQSLASVGSANQLLTSNGAGNLPTFQARKATCETVYCSGASSSTLTNPTSVTAFDTHTYTIPANDLVAGVAYEFEIAGTFVRAAGNATGHIMLGSTDISNSEIQFGAASGRFYVSGTVYGTTAAGASVAVRASFIAGGSNVAAVAEGDYISTSAIATNGPLVLQFGSKFSASDGGNNATLNTCKIKKISSTAF